MFDSKREWIIHKGKLEWKKMTKESEKKRTEMEWKLYVCVKQTFRAGVTGQDDSFFWPMLDFCGVIGMERTLVGCGGNRLLVFNELALLFDIVFLVMTGPNLILALVLPYELLSPTLKLAICRSMPPPNLRPLSKLSISSNWEKMSGEKVNCQLNLNCFDFGWFNARPLVKDTHAHV